MLLIKYIQTGRLPEDMPKEGWLLLVYAGKNRFLAYYRAQKDGIGIWEHEDVQRKICKGDVWVKVPEYPI